jgi:cell division septal protein FtsQ
VKDVHIRKVFPSSLKIYVRERIPVARLERNGVYLIDRDNSIIKRITPGEADHLPLVKDRGNFHKDYQQKMKSVWSLWDKLSREEKELISMIDVSFPDNLSVHLKEDLTRIILGKTEFSQKLHFYLQNKDTLNKYGRLEYVDLRFQDRIYIKASDKPIFTTAARR